MDAMVGIPQIHVQCSPYRRIMLVFEQEETENSQGSCSVVVQHCFLLFNSERRATFPKVVAMQNVPRNSKKSGIRLVSGS